MESNFKVGQTVLVKTPDFPGRQFLGVIEAVYPDVFRSSTDRFQYNVNTDDLGRVMAWSQELESCNVWGE